VIIAVRNRPRLVLKTLTSVIQQTRAADQVVVIDDGSTDETASAVADFIAATNGAPVTLLRRPHAGSPAARNVGLARLAPTIEAVAFLDSDDVWPDDFLVRTTALLERDSDAVAVSADRILHFVDDGRTEGFDAAELEASPWRYMIRHGGGVGSCTLFRRSAIVASGGFSEDWPTGHDTMLFAKVARLGRWRHAPGAPVTMAREFSATHADEEGHIYHRFPDFRWRWAKASEHCLACAPRELRADPAIRAVMRLRWALARRQALEHYRLARAAICFFRSLRYATTEAERL
jgi:glycosyltransferase involved in cell wall biosynthesis